MNKAVLAVIILSVAMLACGSAIPTLNTADDYVNEFGGNRDVYERILSLTDCHQLQSEFDTAYENSLRDAGTPKFKWSEGYMKAADNRMKEMGCYEQSSNDFDPTAVDISIIIAQTSHAALTQTQWASSPTPYFTVTFLPTLTLPATLVPSQTSEPTATVVFILPTSPSAGSSSGSCICSNDSLNCSDFSSQASAQACMDYCISIGAGDIHNLDGNADGVACESL